VTAVPVTAEVVIVGGGSTGASIAYHLARRGVAGVLLLEQGFLASGATGRSSAIVRQHYAYPVTARMARLALDVFRRFDDVIGGECGFTRTGYLALVGPDDREALAGNVAMQQGVGVRTRVVGAAEIRDLVPQMAVDDLAAAAHEPDAGYADPAATTASLARRARDLGARILEGTAVRRLVVERGAVAGVETGAGTVATRTVVAAAGGWTPRLLAPLGVEVPITNTLHQIGVFERPADFGPGHPVCGDFVSQVYFRPEQGGLTLVGSTKHTHDEVVDPDDYPAAADPGWLQEFAERSVHRFPGLEAARSRGGWAGFYDTTPDFQFVLDRAPGVAGLFVAAGFSGHGFKHSPIIGDLVADLVLGTPPADPHVDLGFFALSRFAAGRPHRPRYAYAKVLLGR
jgi:glycine/D-amino acid oxidase-like deaminating enzyme